MTQIEQDVATYYGAPDLMAVLIAAAGYPDGRIDAERLERIDEFHVGGSPATVRVLDGLKLTPGQKLLDIGSGIGGPCRRAARDYGLDVTGIDLTAGFVSIAKELTTRLATRQPLRFAQGSALALPFADASFDAAMLLHVGMNIPGKRDLMAEVARVLRPDGKFAVYDIMRMETGSTTAPLDWPLPWATGPASSYVGTAADYRAAAAAAGLSLIAEQTRAAEARAFFAAGRADAAAARAAGLPPPIGIGMMMGVDAAAKLGNLAAAIERGILAPVEMYFRKPASPRHP